MASEAHTARQAASCQTVTLDVALQSRGYSHSINSPSCAQLSRQREAGSAPGHYAPIVTSLIQGGRPETRPKLRVGNRLRETAQLPLLPSPGSLQQHRSQHCSSRTALRSDCSLARHLAVYLAEYHARSDALNCAECTARCSASRLTLRPSQHQQRCSSEPRQEHDQHYF